MKVTKKELEQLKQDLINDLLSKVEITEDTHYELKYPKNGEVLYFLYNLGTIDEITYGNHWAKEYSRGLIFKTREEAEHCTNERQLLFKIKRWAEEKNGDWQPDWSDSNIVKYCVCINKNTLLVDCHYLNNHIYKLPYFKSEEIAQECIDLFGDEILDILGEK